MEITVIGAITWPKEPALRLNAIAFPVHGKSVNLNHRKRQLACPRLAQRLGVEPSGGVGKVEVPFDAGPSPEILENNYRALNLKLEGLSFAFLSHPHHDHCGGLPAIARTNPGIEVFVPAGAAHCVPDGLKAVEVKGIEEVAEDFWSTGTLRSSPVDEQSAVVKADGRNVLLVGCSHPGVGRITELVRSRFGDVFFVIGGFHQPSEDQLRKAFSAATYVAPAHCSGDEAKRRARELGERFVEVRTGTSIAIEDDERPLVIHQRGRGVALPAFAWGSLPLTRALATLVVFSAG